MINALKLTSALVMKVNTGVDEEGKDIFRNISFKKIKPAAADQDVFDVASAITTVLDATVTGIQRQDLSDLVNA